MSSKMILSLMELRYCPGIFCSAHQALCSPRLTVSPWTSAQQSQGKSTWSALFTILSLCLIDKGTLWDLSKCYRSYNSFLSSLFCPSSFLPISIGIVKAKKYVWQARSIFLPAVIDGRCHSSWFYFHIPYFYSVESENVRRQCIVVVYMKEKWEFFYLCCCSRKAIPEWLFYNVLFYLEHNVSFC